jgi:hypothetical protein
MYIWYFIKVKINFICEDHIGGVMVSVLTSSVVDYGFETWSGATNYQTIKLVFVASLVGIHY